MELTSMSSSLGIASRPAAVGCTPQSNIKDALSPLITTQALPTSLPDPKTIALTTMSTREKNYVDQLKSLHRFF